MIGRMKPYEYADDLIIIFSIFVLWFTIKIGVDIWWAWGSAIATLTLGLWLLLVFSEPAPPKPDSSEKHEPTER